MRVFAIGRPIGTLRAGSGSSVSSYEVANSVVSVGP